MNNSIITKKIGKFCFDGVDGNFWKSQDGKVLFLDLWIDKRQTIPSDEKINTLVCFAFDVEIRSFDADFFDKNNFWFKSFSYWLGDKNA